MCENRAIDRFCLNRKSIPYEEKVMLFPHSETCSTYGSDCLYDKIKQKICYTWWANVRVGRNMFFWIKIHCSVAQTWPRPYFGGLFDQPFLCFIFEHRAPLNPLYVYSYRHTIVSSCFHIFLLRNCWSRRRQTETVWPFVHLPLILKPAPPIIEWASAQVPPTPLLWGPVERGRER